MASIEEILARAKPRVEVTSICLAGDLRAEHDRLTAELEIVQRRQVSAKLSGNGEAKKLAEHIQQLEGDMGKAMQEFRFSGMSGDALENLQDRFPAREGKREVWNHIAGAPALVAACAVEPSMSEAQAEMLRKSLAQGDWDLLVEAAWQATTSKESVPFSVRASVLTGGSAQK